MVTVRFVRWFEELSLDDVPLVGGKNASLGEMYRELGAQGVRLPNGFATTVAAFRETVRAAGIEARLHELLDDVDKSDVRRLASVGTEARELVYGAGLPEPLEQEVRAAWRKLVDQYGLELSVAVRSSATAEDLPTASFAGQHDTFLNVRGEAMLLDAVRRCMASLFTDRAIGYRIDQGFDHFQVALSIGVMKMVRADLASAGVMFSLDTESGFRDVVFITGAYGLGENVVQGTVDTDEFYVHKPTFAAGHRCVLRHLLGRKQVKMVYTAGRTREPTRNMPTPRDDREVFCLADAEVLELAGYAIAIEDHYSRRAGRPMPMDMEWAKDGLDGKLYVIQARPETVASQRRPQRLEQYRLTGKGEIRVEGRAIGARIASGQVRIVRDAHHLADFEPGEVLVSDTTTPDWEPVVKTAAAVVTNRGGRTCHAAIVARELGIPAVVGAENATHVLGDGETVTVCCAEGEIGRIYAGAVPFEVDEHNVGQIGRPQTHIMLNVGNPDLAFGLSFLPNDGVGLARMEFVVNTINVHPMALVLPERVEDERERHEIARLTRHYAKPTDYFVQRLAEGIGTIAAAFWPKPVIVRLSDFKSNEYAALLGGRAFEPFEANPMLGFRGAARYAHPAYREGFALECAALRRVREDMGLTNLKVMVPFCRRVEEARRVLDALAEHGLVRGKDGLEVYVMCEIPNNVVSIDAFSELFDGFSIGSNDLTQLVRGVDRDSELVAFDFDERDPGVIEMLRLSIEAASAIAATSASAARRRRTIPRSPRRSCASGSIRSASTPIACWRPPAPCSAWSASSAGNRGPGAMREIAGTFGSSSCPGTSSAT